MLDILKFFLIEFLSGVAITLGFLFTLGFFGAFKTVKKEITKHEQN